MSESPYEKMREVYNNLGQNYIEDSEHLEPVERTRFLELFNEGDSILDVGCGGGRDSKYFFDNGLNVTGVDASDVFIENAKELIPDAKFIQGNLLDINFPENTFDGVWAQAVLLHLKRDDVEKALKLFYRLLKPGGMIHVRVKKGEGEAWTVEKLSRGNSRFYTYFTLEEMKSLVINAGFEIFYSDVLPDELKRVDVDWVVVWGRK